MKNLLAILLLTAVTLSASGCGFLQEGSLRDLDYVTSLEETYVQDCMDRLTEAMKTQDAQKIKDLFSCRAQKDTEDLDAAIKNLLEQVGDGVVSWEKLPMGSYSEGHSYYGSQSMMISVWTSIKTDTQEYAVLLQGIYEDTNEPDNEGLIALLIFREHYSDLDASWLDWNEPGLHFPRTMLEESHAEEYVAERMEQLTEALQEQDRRKVKELFSVQDLANAKDLDASIEELFSLMGTNVISWEILPDGIESWRNYSCVRLTTWVSLKTDTGEFVVMLLDFPLNESKPAEQGLCSIQVFSPPYEDINKNYVTPLTPGVHIFADTERGEE
ncbi:MAG: DUF5104 domain-containing protein [Clostridia bacterium]|nr:DUF5104 domain-containing protein [Clostridia bacterium]